LGESAGAGQWPQTGGVLDVESSGCRIQLFAAGNQEDIVRAILQDGSVIAKMFHRKEAVTTGRRDVIKAKAKIVIFFRTWWGLERVHKARSCEVGVEDWINVNVLEVNKVNCKGWTWSHRILMPGFCSGR
jgi:hypothetical protein